MHFFYFGEEHLEGIQKLFENKCDGEYVILNQNGKYTDIAQFSGKYQTVRVITVKTPNLNPNYELA